MKEKRGRANGPIQTDIHEKDARPYRTASGNGIARREWVSIVGWKGLGDNLLYEM